MRNVYCVEAFSLISVLIGCGLINLAVLGLLGWLKSRQKRKRDQQRELLAAYAHEAWVGWMRYLFSKCSAIEGRVVIPFWAVERWKRQMATLYAELPEAEKQSDRAEADRILGILEKENIDEEGL